MITLYYSFKYKKDDLCGSSFLPQIAVDKNLMCTIRILKEGAYDMSRFMLNNVAVITPGSGEEHRYLCECIDTIKANKTNTYVLNEQLDAISRILSRCFDMKVTTTILDSIMDNDFFGINIYPSVNAARAIVDVACDTVGVDDIYYGGETFDSPGDVIRSIWRNNNEWHIDFDGKLFYSPSQMLTAREIVALLLYKIEQTVFCNESVMIAYKSIRHITLNVDRRTAVISKSTRCRNFFMIPIIQTCGFTNFKSEIPAESIFMGVEELHKDYLALLTKIATQYSSSLIDRPSYELKQDITYIMTWVMEALNDLKYSMEKLKRSLSYQIAAEKSYYVKNILVSIMAQFTTQDQSTIEESYNPETPESKALKEAVLMGQIVKEFDDAAHADEQKLLDKLGRCKRVTQEEIDVLRLEVEKIQSVDDKIYYMEKVHDKLNIVEYALTLIGDRDTKGRVRDSKALLKNQLAQLIQIREIIMNKRISPERYGLFIKYPAGYEG